jgi:demethylmenaquinone methyltransferase/2-methoxy-6-polyprenyl-1,4-benzoquinol methylase
VIRTHFQRVLPWLTHLSTGSEPAVLLMKYYWDTIDQCVTPETILDVLRRNGFTDVKRRVYCGFLSEYVAAKPGKPAPPRA